MQTRCLKQSPFVKTLILFPNVTHTLLTEPKPLFDEQNSVLFCNLCLKRFNQYNLHVFGTPLWNACFTGSVFKIFFFYCKWSGVAGMPRSPCCSLGGTAHFIPQFYSHSLGQATHVELYHCHIFCCFRSLKTGKSRECLRGPTRLWTPERPRFPPVWRLQLTSVESGDVSSRNINTSFPHAHGEGSEPGNEF